MLLDFFPKSLVDLNTLCVTIVVPLVKRIKRKEKLELFGNYAKKSKPVFSENSMLLKKMFNTLNSLTMCISGSHSSNPRLNSLETLIPNNHSIWDEEEFLWLNFCSFGP